MGVFEPKKKGGIVYPVSKKQKKEFHVAEYHTLKAAEGDIVRVEILNEGAIDLAPLNFVLF
jgi:hypothetical protein